MAFELEALVGHLYIQGGRVIKTTPPGALSEVAPKKAARGREQDTFFVLVLPSGTNAPISFYEQMAMMSAERYFATSGSVTSALRDVFNSLNNNLFEHNASGRKHYEASMACAVLRNNELYLAKVGACALVLRNGAENASMPDNIADEESLFQPPLGVTPIPEVAMKRFNVSNGTRLLLVDANIAEVRSDKLINAMISSNIEHSLDELKMLITNQTQAMLIEFVPPDVPAPVTVVVGESSKTISTELNAQKTTTAEIPNPMLTTANAVPNLTPAVAPMPKKPNVLVRFLGRVAGILGAFLASIGRILGRFLGRSADSPSVKYGAGVTAAAIFLLPLLVVVIVVVSWASGIGETRFETCVAEANSAADVARRQDTNNPGGVLAAWEATFLKVNECENLRSGDFALLSLRREGQDVVDRIRNIERRPLNPIAVLPNAQIKSLILQGLDMYALDTRNNLVYRWQISTEGGTAATQPLPITSLRQGATVDGLTMGEILDIAYDGENIVALGRNGVLFECPPRFINECDGQLLQGSDGWRNPVALSIWRGNLYILDTGNNQLLRYQPSGGTFGGVPTEYFTGTLRPDLQSAVDFSISTAGNTAGAVYVLYGNGVMTKHFSGEPDPFAFAGFPDGQELQFTTVNAMFLNDSPIDTAFYIISPASRSIYETSIAGAFIASYRAEDEQVLENMTDIVTDPSQQIMYVSAGSAVYAMSQR
jgi:hypothetical protein